jgi:putative effector of murein hydrolase
MMYISFFLFLFLGPCILIGYLVFTDIDYCIYDIGGLWITFVVCVYGFVFMDMCLWICV